jgi:hypothetical protein
MLFLFCHGLVVRRGDEAYLYFPVTSFLLDALAWRYAMLAKIDDARLTISMVKDLDFMVAIWRNCRSALSSLVLSLALVGERGP